MSAPRIVPLVVTLALSALLAACASTPRPQAVYVPPPAARVVEQPPQQSAVIAPRAYCPSPAFEVAAKRNTESLRTLEFAPFGRPEHGWEVYAPALVAAVGSDCPVETPQFAERLAAWQGAHGLPASGELDAATFGAIKTALQFRRPFLKARSYNLCPDPAIEDTLAQASPTESRWDKPVKLRPAALASYRRMVETARREVPQAFTDPELLRIFSAYRSPTSDDARCAADGNCNGLVRAQCSAHRTGLAMDIMVGHAPGSKADSTEDANRLYQTRTAVYRWLISNAGRFGFVNYPFEPWHWEWTGEPLLAQGRPITEQTGPALAAAAARVASARTYAQSSTAGRSPPRPSSPAGPDPLDWLPRER